LLVAAALLGAWVAWRWLGFVVGFVRLRAFDDPAIRAEARRTVIARGAYNVFISVVAFYLWASGTQRQPGEALVGFLAAATMCSLAIGISAGFMQPQERDPRTLSVCRIRPTPLKRDPEGTP
jgi:hypothetical protein